MQIFEIFLLPVQFDPNHFIAIFGILMAVSAALFSLPKLHNIGGNLRERKRLVKLRGFDPNKEEAYLIVIDSQIKDSELRLDNVCKRFPKCIYLGLLGIFASLFCGFYQVLFLFVILCLICIPMVIFIIKSTKDVVAIYTIPKSIEKLDEIIEKVDKKDYLGIIGISK